MALIGPMSGSLTKLETGSPFSIGGNATTVSSTDAGGNTITSAQRIGMIMLGDRASGNATLTAIDAGVVWATSSSAGYAMNRDVFLNNLTVNSGVTLAVQGFQLYIAGTLLNSGTIESRGASTTTATAPGGGNGSANTYGTSNSAGGNGGSAAGGVGANPAAQTNALGGAGGGGGSTSGFAGGSGGTVTAPIATVTSWKTLNFLTRQRIYSATSQPAIAGGGGGGGGAVNTLGTSMVGGGGGAGGVNMFLLMNVLDNAGTIQSRGGNGANASGTGAQSGGGGGGGGGAVLVAANKVLSLGTIQSIGGSGGTGNLGGAAGTSGGVGPVVLLTGSV